MTSKLKHGVGLAKGSETDNNAAVKNNRSEKRRNRSQSPYMLRSCKKQKVEENETTSKSDETNINALPKEVLSIIFKKLPVKQRIRIERVCKRWRQIAFSRSFSPWNDLHKVYIKPHPHINKGRAECQRRVGYGCELAKRIGPNLRELKVNCFCKGLRNICRAIGPHVRNLQYLGVRENRAAKAKKQQLLCIPKCTPNLKGLSLHVPYLNFDAGIVDTILKGLPNLETLDLWIDLVHSEKLSKMPSKLNKLRISEICDEAWPRLLARTAADCPDLLELQLEVQKPWNRIGPPIYRELTKFQNLKSLFLPKGEPPAPASLISAIEAMRNVQHLDLFTVNEPLLRTICECSQLQILHFKELNCPAKSLWELTKLSRLRELVFTINRNEEFTKTKLSEEEQQTVRQVLAAIVKKAPLEHLVVEFTGSSEFVTNSLLRPCKSLSAICLPGNLRPHEICAKLEALAAEEQTTTAKGRWPIDVLYVEGSGNVVGLESCEQIHWHARYDYDGRWQQASPLRIIQDRMLRKVLPTLHKSFSESQTLTCDDKLFIKEMK